LILLDLISQNQNLTVEEEDAPVNINKGNAIKSGINENLMVRPRIQEFLEKNIWTLWWPVSEEGHKLQPKKSSTMFFWLL
jgi:hypothetical protein